MVIFDSYVKLPEANHHFFQNLVALRVGPWLSTCSKLSGSIKYGTCMCPCFFYLQTILGWMGFGPIKRKNPALLEFPLILMIRVMGFKIFFRAPLKDAMILPGPPPPDPHLSPRERCWDLQRARSWCHDSWRHTSMMLIFVDPPLKCGYCIYNHGV